MAITSAKPYAGEQSRLAGKMRSLLPVGEKGAGSAKHLFIDLGAIRLEYQMRATREHLGANAWVPVSHYLSEQEQALIDGQLPEADEHWIADVVRPKCEQLYKS